LLATRVATAAVGIPIIFGLIWIGGWPYAVVAAAFLAIAAAEVQHLRWPWLSLATIASALVVFAVIVAIPAAGAEGAVTVGIFGLVVLAVEVWRPTIERLTSFRYWGGYTTGLAMAYVGTLGSTIVLLREQDNGRDWVYLALFSTFAVDTAAYFVGRAIGRHKLVPAISPKKTWEGFFGGYAGGIAAVLLLNYFLGLRIDAGPAVLIALTLPVVAAVGDLFESWVKRRAGVKDASELIPGHGGVLDRLDSVLFVFPLVYVVARWVA
jgi:phosphatidate cytidylyltransferase